jgi:hypothetical protein
MCRWSPKTQDEPYRDYRNSKQAKFDESASDVPSNFDDLAQRSRAPANTVSSAAAGLSARLPDAATQVDRLIQSSSNETLRVVAAAAVGIAIGLLIAGANRLLVVIALIPAGIVGLAISGRRSV